MVVKGYAIIPIEHGSIINKTDYDCWIENFEMRLPKKNTPVGNQIIMNNKLFYYSLL